MGGHAVTVVLPYPHSATGKPVAEVRYFHQPWARSGGDAPMTDEPDQPAESEWDRFVISSMTRYIATCQLCGWVSDECGFVYKAEEQAKDHQHTHIDGRLDAR